MARPVIKFDQKHCAECGIRLPPVAFKRPFAKMCHDCRGDNRSDNQELKKIYRELKSQATTETEDWGSQNITTKDDAMLRHHRF